MALSDRASREAHIPVDEVRAAISALCFWPGSLDVRRLALERVHGVANAHKHLSLDKNSHVVASFDDVLAVGLGYGLDGYGVGKYGGVEVLVRDKNGESWKFQGDALTVIGAWLRYLRDSGTALPAEAISVCSVQVHL